MSSSLQIVSLQQVLKRADIWQASQRRSQHHSIASGYSPLDKLLHIGGWPLNRLTEILVEQSHIGEIQLVLPAIAKAMQKGGWLFLVEPPFNPYAPAWLKANIDIQKMIIIQSCQEKDWLWAVEQVIGHQGICCTLFWPPKDNLSNKVLKRLQLAAEQGSKLNFIFRSMSVVSQSSPASLRLVVKKPEREMLNTRKIVHSRKIAIEVLKQSGGWSGQKVVVDLSDPGRSVPPYPKHSLRSRGKLCREKIEPGTDAPTKKIK